MTRAVLFLSLAFAGCIPIRPAWVAVEGTFEATKAGYEVEGPPGWMRLNPADQDLVMTRGGVRFQRIAVSASEVGKPIGLGASKRPATAGMSPQELGELIADDLRTIGNIIDLRIVERAPASLSGREGVRVLAAFREGGLLRRTVVCAVEDGGWVYVLLYSAQERRYFEHDLPVFERVLQSFKLLGPAKAPPPEQPPAPPPT